MAKILLIECCNFQDFPTGGQLTFAKHMLSSFKDDLILIGLARNKHEVGQWTTVTINKINYKYFGYLYLDRNSRKPLIPLRLRNYFALMKHKHKFFNVNTKNILVQSPDTFLGLYGNDSLNICYRFAGTENPLSISRYRIGRSLSFLFDRMFLPKLKHAKLILAAADNKSISNLIKRSKGYLSHSSVTQFPTRIDTDIFFKKSKEYCREQIHYPINQLLIITTGRLGWFKGWKFMIDSFLLFKSHFPASKLFFIGNGEDFQKITDYISLLNCNNDIELLGYQSQENISDFLNAADLFIMGSYKEGWSTSLMEAIACGVPACVTNFSSAKEIIAEGINGFVVEGHDEQLFSQTMIKALSINNSHLPRQIDVEKYSVSLLKQDLNNKWELV